MERPLIEECYLGEEDLDCYYLSSPYSAMAIHIDAPPETKRSRELEAYGYHLYPPHDGERPCFAVESFDDIDEISIAAVKRGLDGNITDGEIRAVVDAFRESDMPDVCWIEWRSGQHIHTVMAVLDTLYERGTLPTHPTRQT